MNCENCGAAMRLVSGRDYFACDYCTSFAFPCEKSAGKDRVIPLAEQSTLACPVCGIVLHAARVDAFAALSCTRCRGVLLTNEHFGHVVRQRRKLRQTPPHDPIPLDAEDLRRELHCPCCGGPCDTHPYYGPGAVVVDTCPRCHVIWVDHGELYVIEHAPGSVRQ